MKVFAREALVVVAIIIAAIVLFFALYGAATLLSPLIQIELRPSAATEFANWIQAVGSIAAIGGSYFVGAYQANRAHDSAMAVYAAQRADQSRAEKDRIAKEKADSLFAIAAATAGVRRLQRDVATLIVDFEPVLTQYDQAQKLYRDMRAKRQSAHLEVAPSEKQENLESIEATRQEVAEAIRASLTPHIQVIDDLIVRIDALPRAQISIVSKDLSLLLVRAINGLNRAALEAIHSPSRAKVTDWLKDADKALDKFILDLASPTSESSVGKAVQNMIPLP